VIFTIKIYVSMRHIKSYKFKAPGFAKRLRLLSSPTIHPLAGHTLKRRERGVAL
jgi:hypothetical protein